LRARIYQPTRNAMQSGNARTKEWVLEYEPRAPQPIDPLMGWTGSADTLEQLRLFFETKDEAIAYAQKRAIAYDVFEPHRHTPKPKAYADNFRYDRKVPWSH
jgi:hypothetical protein